MSWINMNSVFVIAVIAAGSMVYCHVVANRRGLKPVFWGVMGLLFGPLAIPFVYLLKPRKTH